MVSQTDIVNLVPDFRVGFPEFLSNAAEYRLKYSKESMKRIRIQLLIFLF